MRAFSTRVVLVELEVAGQIVGSVVFTALARRRVDTTTPSGIGVASRVLNGAMGVPKRRDEPDLDEVKTTDVSAI
jgi:hypothetical protein